MLTGTYLETQTLSILLRVFAALLPFFLGCSTVQSIDRGLHSASEALSQTDRVTGERTLSLQNRQQQIKAGNDYAEKLIVEARAGGKKINEEVDPATYQRIVALFTRLHAVSHMSDEQWTPVLIENDEWNAFTTGGTYFVIYSKLANDLTDDSELANVIAHEMAHTAANHVFEGGAIKRIGALTSKTAQRASFQSAFTHENEAEADRIAVLYSALAGFDPYAGARIWQRQFAQSGNGAGYLHDHPMNSERAELSKQTAGAVAAYYSAGAANPDSKNILAKNSLYTRKEAAKTEAGKGGGLLAMLDIAMTTATQKQQAKAEEKRQLARINFIQAVQKLSRITESKAVGSNVWQLKMHYRGNIPITNVILNLHVKRVGTPLTITRSLSGVLRPNAHFAVTFDSPELDAYRINSRDTSVSYDNATNLQ